MSPFKPEIHDCPDPSICDSLSMAEKYGEEQKARADNLENQLARMHSAKMEQESRAERAEQALGFAKGELKVLKEKIGDIIGEDVSVDDNLQYMVECRKCGHENWEYFKDTDYLVSLELHTIATNKLEKISKVIEMEPAEPSVKGTKSLGMFANFVKADREDRKAAGDKDIADDL